MAAGLPFSEWYREGLLAGNDRVVSHSGSNIENWHSIMRKGLINATGTQYQVGLSDWTHPWGFIHGVCSFHTCNVSVQLHGAAHGSGVYLSPKSNVSFGYTTTLPAHKKAKLVSWLEANCLTVSYVYCVQSEVDCLAGKLNLRCLALCEG